MQDEIQLDESQQNAVEFCKNNKIVALTSPAGHGKTFLIGHIARELKKQGESVELCSFTGRASSRITEETGFKSSTIHSMLQYRGTHFSRNTLEGISIICDESSMLSSCLLAEIIKRNPSRLILAGDVAQLLPIEEGQPFHDIINLYPEMVAELTTSHRAKEAIYKAATEIRHGQIPKNLKSEGELFTCINTGNPQKTHDYILRLIKSEFLNLANTIILCPRNGKQCKDTKEFPPATINKLNIDIKKIVNPSEDRISENDKIMCTKNLSEDNLFNGTLGTAVINDGVFNFLKDDGVMVPLSKAKIKHIQLAYCITTHKFQGSQSDNIIFVCLERDSYSLLNRPMIYTAITRAKKKCIVIGEMQAMKRAINIVPKKRTVLQKLSEDN